MGDVLREAHAAALAQPCPTHNVPAGTACFPPHQVCTGRLP